MSEPERQEPPVPPEPGDYMFITGANGEHLVVRAKACSCSKECVKRGVRYFVYEGVENIDGVPQFETGRVVSGAEDWRRLCHVKGWYPLDGLSLGDKLPRNDLPPKPTRREVAAKKAAKKQAEREASQPELVWDGLV